MIVGIMASTLRRTSTASYDFHLKLIDSYGDGWNGNYLERVRGTGEIVKEDLLDGFERESIYTLKTGETTDIYYLPSGTYPEEISLSLSHKNGGEVIDYPVGSFNGIIEKTLLISHTHDTITYNYLAAKFEATGTVAYQSDFSLGASNWHVDQWGVVDSTFRSVLDANTSTKSTFLEVTVEAESVLTIEWDVVSALNTGTLVIRVNSVDVFSSSANGSGTFQYVLPTGYNNITVNYSTNATESTDYAQMRSVKVQHKV